MMASLVLRALILQLSLVAVVALNLHRYSGEGHDKGHDKTVGHGNSVGNAESKLGVMNKFGVTRYNSKQLERVKSTEGFFWPDSASRSNKYAGPEDLMEHVSWGWHHPNGVYNTIPIGAPVIDDEGCIYIGSDDAIRKFDVSGDLKWSYAPRGQLAAAPTLAISSPAPRLADRPTEFSAEEEVALEPDWAKHKDAEVDYQTFFSEVKVGDRLKVRPGLGYHGDGKEFYKAGDQGEITKILDQESGDTRVVIQWPRTDHESIANLASLGKRFVRLRPNKTETLPPMMVGSTTSGYVFAIDITTGEEVWATQASEQIQGVKGAVGAKDGVVVVATNRCVDRYCYRYRNQTNPLTPMNSYVRGLSLADGSAIWSFKVARSPVWNMVPQWGPDDTVMFQDVEANAYCLKFKTGEVVWKTLAPMGMGTYTQAAALYCPETNFLFTMGVQEYDHKYCNPYPAPGILPHCNTWPGAKGIIYGLNATSGRVRWMTDTHEPPASATIGRLNSPPGHVRLVVTLGYNCKFNSPTVIWAVDPHNGHVRWEKDGPTLWSGMCAGDKEGGDIRRAMGGRAACVPNSWSTPVIDSNGDVFVGNQVGVLQKWGSPTGRTADVQLLSTLTTGVAFTDSAIAFAPGIMAVSTCTSLIVFQTDERRLAQSNVSFSPYEY